MRKLIEIKKLLRLHEIRKVEPTKITLGIFNFSTGNVDHYDFMAHYVGKIPYGSSAFEDNYANHVVTIYGIITYENGQSYKEHYKLTYTDDVELDKLLQPIKEGVSGSYQIFADALNMY